jgi:hypothetical protein
MPLHCDVGSGCQLTCSDSDVRPAQRTSSGAMLGTEENMFWQYIKESAISLMLN